MKLSNYIVALIVIAGAIATAVYVQTTATLPATGSAVDGMLANVGLPNQDLHYVGAQTCETCHASEYQQWQQSDHFKAMQLPTTSTVLGDFSDVTVKFHQIESRFYQFDDKYLVDTSDAQGKLKTFEIKHTFGFYPLQQYLIETQKGHVQAFNVAWDSRPKEEGGSRWFHLREDELITPEHPFYWTKHFQNWNSRCADCHSTNLQRNYDISDNSFNTTFSETNVACEACHGPASKHLAMAKSSKLDQGSGFDIEKSVALQWQFGAEQDIAQPVGQLNDDDLNMCGACHALRRQLSDAKQGGDFHDLNRLALVNQSSYFADGQSREEAFVAGSFLQSKMHHKGVTCSNCHNPHTAKVLVEGNGLCAQCHTPQVFDAEQHHHHQSGSEGALCVSCHMPERAFMKVDMRRDHSFTIPRPDLSLALGVPNACTQCHSDKDNAWAQLQTKQWGVKSSGGHWAHLLQRATQRDSLVTRAAVESILNTGLPDLIRASLLASLAPLPSRVSADVARLSLYDKNPLLRRAAVTALRGQTADVRWQLLSPYIGDPNRSVRMQIAENVADIVTQLPTESQPAVYRLIEEYREMLNVSGDAVSTQLNIANLELRLGKTIEAEQAYQQALIIEPGFVPALLALADLYRHSGRLGQEQPLLDRALKIAPDSGAVQHSVGLFHVRQKNYAAALDHLGLATEQVDAAPYYAYVFGVALENQGRISDAIKSLMAADQRWPNQYEILLTLILYLEKSGDADAVLPFLSKLSAIAPAAPEVKQLINKYQSR
jgi:predicted CXXCH cytochrome family protein